MTTLRMREKDRAFASKEPTGGLLIKDQRGRCERQCVLAPVTIYKLNSLHFRGIAFVPCEA
jgi:hypothetical protein